MNKIIAVAALAAASFAVPTVPALAQSAYPAHCLILPLLQADCRAAISDALSMDAEPAPVVVAAAATTTVADAVDTATSIAWPIPRWWTCTPAAEGAKYLLECD